ncbi:MAG: SMC domain-containing protein [Cenarchaeum symbiont of Oopsacas minuta]|nr:SMC domain-containing protein [Cenarchaeum symbiont of Oopsacas minuta]
MIESIKMMDFLSHKKTEICLCRNTSVFVGNNGTGKSSVVDAITFALFGKHTRKNNKGLVRRGANTAFVQIIFTIDDTKYMASRKICLKGETSATLKMHDGTEWQVLITGERREFGESMTRRVEEILGMSYDKLLIAGIVHQGDLISIVEDGPKKFKETLNDIIGIDRLDIAAASMGDAIKNFRAAMSDKLGYDDTAITQIKYECDAHHIEIKRLEPLVKKHKERMQSAVEQTTCLKSQLEEGREKLEAATELHAHQEELARYLKDHIFTMRKKIKTDDEKITKCIKCFNVLDTIHYTRLDLERTEQQGHIGKKSIQDLKSSLARLEEKLHIAASLHLIDGKCPVCDSTVDSLKPIYDEKQLNASIEETKSHINAMEQNLTELELECKRITKELDIERDTRSELRKYNILDKNQIYSLQQDVDECKQTIQTLLEFDQNNYTPTTRVIIDERTKQIYTTIERLRSKVAGFNEKEFQKIRTQIEDSEQQMLLIQNDLGADSEALKQACTQMERKSKLLSELEFVAGFVSELNRIRDIVYGRDGHVAMSLRSWALGSISEKAVMYLDMFDTKVQRIELEDKKKDFAIKCYSGTTELDIKSLSGGERVCVALAMRLALAAIFGASRLNFVILDEPTAHLDTEKKSALVKAITQRSDSQNESHIQLVIISHDREIFENAAVEDVYTFESSGSLPDSSTIVKSN